jgi:SAM-dependent methyltransferase
VLPSALEQIELVCPRCRRVGPDGVVAHPLDVNDVWAEEQGFALAGFLSCTNHACGFEYPIVCGVPCVVRGFEAWWAQEGLRHAAEGCPGHEWTRFGMGSVVAADAAGRPDYWQSFLDSHYGAFADPSPSEDTWADTTAFWSAVIHAAGRGGHGGVALDIGSSVGRHTFELAGLYDFAVGIDTKFEALAAAAAFQRSGHVNYERRTHASGSENVSTSFEPAANVLFVLADALDPPFRAGAFAFTAALNLVDTIPHPRVLLGQMDALLAGGGRMVLTSPYAWREDVVERAEWLEDASTDPADALRAILTGDADDALRLSYEIQGEVPELPWPLRIQRRYWSFYKVHLIQARKRERSAG